MNTNISSPKTGTRETHNNSSVVTVVGNSWTINQSIHACVGEGVVSQFVPLAEAAAALRALVRSEVAQSDVVVAGRARGESGGAVLAGKYLKVHFRLMLNSFFSVSRRFFKHSI